MPELRARHFPIAFAFARHEAAALRGSDGLVRTVGPDCPRFDHGPDGDARGLLVAPGLNPSSQDRASIDPLMLPAALVEGDGLAARATVYHAFVPLAASAAAPGDFAAAIIRRAHYTEDAAAMIDALLREHGHHLAIGAHAGFAASEDGFVRYRGALWQLVRSGGD